MKKFSRADPVQSNMDEIIPITITNAINENPMINPYSMMDPPVSSFFNWLNFVFMQFFFFMIFFFINILKALKKIGIYKEKYNSFNDESCFK